MVTINLKEVAESKGLRLNYLVINSGVSITTVRSYWHKKAQRVDLDVIDRFCELLDVEPGDILKRVTLPTTQETPAHENRNQPNQP